MGSYSTPSIEYKIRECQAEGWRVRLDLHQDQVTEDDLKRLASEPGAASLLKLNLRHKRITNNALAHVLRFECLEELSLWNTGVTDEGLRHLNGLNSLRLLYMRGPNLTDACMPYLSQLKSLKELCLFGTRITDASLRHIGTLVSLWKLYLQGSEITGEGLRDLSALTGLGAIVFNNCKRLTDLRGLDHLLPPTGQLRELRIEHCLALGLPDAVTRETDATRLLKQFRRLHAAPKRHLLSVKVVVLGQGRVGKSSLVARLQSNGEQIGNGEITHDFQIHELPMDVRRRERDYSVACRVFDFGGQPELHSSHRFFLHSRRVVYLLVLKSTRPDDDQENRCEYWLRLIKRQGLDAPVVIVCTHADRPGAGSLSITRVQKLAADIEIQVAGLCDGYANLPRDRFANLALVDRFDTVVDALREAISSMDYIFQANYSPGFFELLNFVEHGHHQSAGGDMSRMAHGYKFFEKEEFDKTAYAISQTDPATAELSDAWFAELRDLGCFHYVGDSPVVTQQRNPHRVGDFCFNPRWVKSPVYLVISNAPQHQNVPQGVIGEEDLRRFLCREHSHAASDPARGHELWGQLPFHPARDVNCLIELMRVCELLFDANDGVEHRFLIPDRLRRVTAPIEDSHADEFRRPIRYEFLPESMLLRFIGRWYSNVRHGHACLNEVKVSHPLCGMAEALVRADVIGRIIVVALFGKNQMERGKIFAHVVNELESIEPCENPELCLSQTVPKRDQWALWWYAWGLGHIQDFDCMKVTDQYVAITKARDTGQIGEDAPEIGNPSSWEKSSRSARPLRKRSRRGRTGRSLTAPYS